MIFFSDAVFAIAITLLALEIRLPAVDGTQTNEQLFAALLDLWPKYMAYILSFLIIGRFWVAHHQRFQLIRRYDTSLLYLNLLQLMFVAFIPFPTAVLSEHSNLTATIFYALSIIVTGLMSALIWQYASHKHRLIDPALTDPQIRRDMMRQFIVPVMFVISIGVAFINIEAAQVIWVLTFPALLILR